MAKKPALEDIDVADIAHEVPKGYPVYATSDAQWEMQVHIWAPIMASPRPRVTSKGTFMPSDYRKHCNMLGASMAYARGLVESKYLGRKWQRSEEHTSELQSH